MSDDEDDFFIYGNDDEYDEWEDERFEYWREADLIGIFGELLIDLDLISNKEWFDIDNDDMENAISNYMFNEPLTGPRMV
jgi:hypothetical protein